MSRNEKALFFKLFRNFFLCGKKTTESFSFIKKEKLWHLTISGRNCCTIDFNSVLKTQKFHSARYIDSLWVFCNFLILYHFTPINNHIRIRFDLNSLWNTRFVNHRSVSINFQTDIHCCFVRLVRQTHMSSHCHKKSRTAVIR